MQHRVEVLLEVDALGEAIGADEHVLARARRPALAMRASRSAGGSSPVTDSIRTLAGSALAKLAGHVIRRVDEAAEDDRLEAVLEQRLDLAHGALELEIARPDDGFGAPGKLQQACGGWRPRALSVSEPGLKSRVTLSSSSP